MATIDQLLAHNNSYAERVDVSHLEAPPTRRLAIVTCMDARLNLFESLGLEPGEAHILRNAGGIVTDDVIRSLAISQLKLGTRDVMLIHHTDCGMEKLTDAGFRAELKLASGAEPPFVAGAFTDVEEDVRESIRRVRDSRFLLHREDVRGFIYDVQTRRLREVEVGP